MEFNFKQQPGIKLLNRELKNDGEPLVSIITPFYNSGKYLRETANSVLNQTFPYFEWIIINDGSSNEEDVSKLLKLAEEDKRIKVYHKENGGIATARNMGIKKANAEIIIPLDADDLLEPTYVECIYWSLYCNPEASWSYTDCVGFFKQEYLWKKTFMTKQMKVDNLLTCTAGIRKKDLIEEGCYAELEKHYNEDWRLWLKLLSKGKYPVHMNWYGFWYRRTDSGVLSIVKDDKEKQKRSLELIKEVGKKVDDNVQAIEFPRYKEINFKKPIKWEWDRTPLLDKRKTKVLMLLPHMVMGGADVFNLDVVSRINKEEFEMSIITTNPGDSSWRQRFEEHVTDIFDLTSFLDIKDWAAFIHYFIKSRDIDIIFVSNSYYGYYLIPWLRKEFPDVAIVDYVHMEEWYWRSGGYARTSGAVGDITEKTYVCNEHLRNVMADSFNRKPEDVETLYIGVDEKEFSRDKLEKGKAKKELEIDEKRPVVLFPCRIHPQKRPFLMIEIAKETRKQIPNISYIVVGDGPQIDELKAKIKKENLEETVYLAGRQKEMKKYYVDSDVTLICSLKEGLSLTSYESMSMGVPVVSSDVGGQRELVDNEVGRILPLMQKEEEIDNREYSKEEIEQYVKAIVEVLNDKDKYEEMSHKSRKKIEEGFTKDLMIKRIEEEFKAIKNGRGIEKRQKIAQALDLIPNFVDDYCTIYCEFFKKDMDAEEIWKAKMHFQELAEKNQNHIEIIKNIPCSDDFALQELQKIYNMRTWKLIQKYRKFMDESFVGKFLSRIRNRLR